MVQINTLQKSHRTGVVSLPKDDLELCGLLDDEGLPRTDVQLLIKMERPGEWRVSVVDDDIVTDDWYTGDSPPETGFSTGSSPISRP